MTTSTERFSGRSFALPVITKALGPRDPPAWSLDTLYLRSTSPIPCRFACGSFSPRTIAAHLARTEPQSATLSPGRRLALAG